MTGPQSLPPVDLGIGKLAKVIAAGGKRTCAILTDDSVKCWGSNFGGALENVEGALGIYGGNRGTTPDDMGDNLPAVNLGTNRKPVALAAGAEHTCALTDDGRVLCWGVNTYGQLGLGDTTNRFGSNMGDALPAVDLGGGHTAIAVSAGGYHTCAILEDHSLKCWGAFVSYSSSNEDDVIPAIPIIGDAPAPVNVGSIGKVNAVASGRGHVCAILNDRTVKCWGVNKNGSLGRGSPQDEGHYFPCTNDAPTVELW